MEALDISDPGIILCWTCVTYESSNGFAYRSHCGAVVEYWKAEFDGQRLDSSLGN